MDKFEKILDIIDHQEKYTDDEIREILRDEECRKLYQTMQEVDSALLKQDAKEVDVDAEWETFCQEHQLEENAEVIPMNPHADEHRTFSWRKIAASIAGFILISGIAFAAIHTYIRKSQKPMLIVEKTELATAETTPNDTTKNSPSSETIAEKPTVHKTFVNVSLDKMLTEIAAYYNLQVKFESSEAKSLRLYYEWDSHTQVEEVVKELNQFDHVDIALKDKEIIVR